VRLAASFPIDGAKNVVVHQWIVLRFGTPMDVATISGNTVVLSDGNPVAARVIPVEHGMLAFINPLEELKPETTYTLTIAGAHDTNGFPLQSTEIHFTTTAATNTTGAKGLPKAPAQPMVPHYGPFLSSEYAAR